MGLEERKYSPDDVAHSLVIVQSVAIGDPSKLGYDSETFQKLSKNLLHPSKRMISSYNEARANVFTGIPLSILENVAEVIEGSEYNETPQGRELSSYLRGKIDALRDTHQMLQYVPLPRLQAITREKST